MGSHQADAVTVAGDLPEHPSGHPPGSEYAQGSIGIAGGDDRRLRISPRIVKRAISKYQARGPNINRHSYKATLEINILTAGP